MSPEASPLIQIKNVSRIFRRGSEEIHVLSGLDLEVQAGDFLALMGPSGSGKSTLLNLIGTLDRPSEGVVRYEGRDVSGLDAWLADDAVFLSPVVHRPQVGKAITKQYLAAAFRVFGNSRTK